MATVYQTQTYTIPPNNNTMSFYGTHGQPSPTSSASPTSPKLDHLTQPHNPNPTKQLRPLKSPLYVPAVLRPTEHFPKASPHSPPRSKRGSLENEAEDDQHPLEQSDLDLYLQHGRIHEEELGEVTGPPTRDHWKPDEASPNCDSPRCRSNFNLFTRKHHCRHCGHIFCSTHASQQIPLDQTAKFHPEGYQVRACEQCHKQYQRWDTARSMYRKHSNSDDSQSGNSTPGTSIGAPPGHRRLGSAIPGRQGQQQQQVAGSLANSVPKDWAWSTF